MGKRPSRREWFLGLVGAVLGAGAAKVADRWLPRSPRPASETWLVRPSRRVAGSDWTSYLRVDGKVEIEPGARPGSFVVRLFDAAGKLSEQFSEELGLICLEAARPCVPMMTGVGAPLAVTTCTYDASERLVQVADAPGAVTRFTFDASDRLVTIKDGGENT